MTLFTTPRQRESQLEELTASSGFFANTAVEQGRYLSPFESLQRDTALTEAELDEETPLIAAEAARERAKTAGASIDIPDEGIREGALNILLERDYEQRRRNDAFNRRPAGWPAAVLGFGAELVGAMQDPINIAASFIPIVGPARYASMISKTTGMMGRAGVRTRVGAMEGAVGNLLVEPMVLQAAVHEQSDYGMTDALLNISLGTVLGAGLHIGAGGIMDAVAKGIPWQRARALPNEPLPRILEQTPPEVRKAALRTSVVQAADGRNVDVQPVLDPVIAQQMAQADRIGDVRVSEQIAAAETQRPPVLGERSPEFQAMRSVQQGIERDYRLAAELGVVDDIERSAAEGLTARQTVNRLGGRLSRVDEIAAANNEPQFATRNKEQLVRSVRSKLDIPSLDEKTEFANWRAGYQARQRLTSSRLRAPKYDPKVATQAARDSFAPENKRSADFRASQTADERLKTAPDDEAMPEQTLEEAVEDATATATALGDPELVTRELADLDDLAKAADEYGNAVRAAASCRLRRG